MSLFFTFEVFLFSFVLVKIFFLMLLNVVSISFFSFFLFRFSFLFFNSFVFFEYRSFFLEVVCYDSDFLEFLNLLSGFKIRFLFFFLKVKKFKGLEIFAFSLVFFGIDIGFIVFNSLVFFFGFFILVFFIA